MLLSWTKARAGRLGRQESTMDIINDTDQAGVGLAVTLAEAARLLSVSTRTIHRLGATGRLRIVRITRDTPRVLRSDLDALLARTATEEAPGDA